MLLVEIGLGDLLGKAVGEEVQVREQEQAAVAGVVLQPCQMSLSLPGRPLTVGGGQAALTSQPRCEPKRAWTQLHLP